MLFMHVPINPVSPSLIEEKQPPIATFKTSLRAWQVRYKARRAALAVDAGKPPNQTMPA
jgi:hypothetical protein